ncbi:MAG: sigma-70 family RNA polymerase sigma factor [Oscillospiraceae bacterium]|nr:sigma-70 family RNA polymerase sigma factor [Oscillospiraceae bacterium]
MEDNKILDLFWARSENAVTETAAKYGRYCTGISMQILHSTLDAEECVNDTWLHAWNSIPPSRPNILQAYLGKITRNLSLDRWKRNTAQKRGGSQVELMLEELGDCVPAADSVQQEIETKAIAEVISAFLREQPEMSRYLFIRRYWYGDSIADLMEKTKFTESYVKTSLFRLRQKLKKRLEKEEVLL